jgi:tRNA1Val (adenine37-N6)-methyltransferase
MKKMEPSRFKQFTIAQDRCPMKVGTDGILLGAWAGTRGVKRILDIGTGTGLIAIMLAQRTSTEAIIDGVEIDALSCQQAQENMAASPWAERLNAVESSVQDYARSTATDYDLIVSNPPFFSGGTISQTQDKTSVRHTVKLPHGDLLSATRNLLARQGRLAVVLPYIEGLRFQELAATYGFHVASVTEVRAKASKPVERLLMEFKFTPGETTKEELVIMKEDGGWTAEFINLTKTYYLHM